MVGLFGVHWVKRDVKLGGIPRPNCTMNRSEINPDSRIHGANVGSTLGRQDPGGPHVGHTNLAVWELCVAKSEWGNVVIVFS